MRFVLSGHSAKGCLQALVWEVRAISFPGSLFFPSLERIKEGKKRPLLMGSWFWNLFLIQLNSGEKDHVTKPLLVNTICWPRTEVVAIPAEQWELLSIAERSSVSKQSSNEAKMLGKRIEDFIWCLERS